jgi:hypothetical protein
MKRSLLMGTLALSAFAFAIPAAAQDKKEVQGYVAAGYVEPEGDVGKFVGGGWNISGGTIFRPNPSRPFAIRFDLGYNRFWATDGTIRGIQTGGPVGSALITDGYVSLTTLTAEGLWEFGGHGRVGGYLGVGFGGMHRYAALTSNVNSGFYCDPWSGICYNTGQSIVDDDSLTKFEYSVAAGMTFNLGSGQLYLEARYHWMDGASPSTEMLPILVGYRF